MYSQLCNYDSINFVKHIYKIMSVWGGGGCEETGNSQHSNPYFRNEEVTFSTSYLTSVVSATMYLRPMGVP